MLCELLKSTGVAGHPEEYFEARDATGLPPHPRDFLAGLSGTCAADLRPAHGPPYSDLRGLADYREHLRRTFELGTTSNGVFGAKLMWSQLPDLHRLTSTVPEFRGVGRTDLLDRLFGNPSYVWISRRDKVRQAISLWRALQTRAWRGEQAPVGCEQLSARYGFAEIDHLARMLAADDGSWARHFAAGGQRPLVIHYEDDLERDPGAATRRVLEHIGVEAPAGWRASAPTARQSDALNDEWLAAYDRDARARAG